jgi:nuclear cap-binding protein subunit 1
MRQEIVQEILVRTAAATNNAIVRGEWREVKLYMKFLGSLQGLLDGDGVFPVLQDILTKAVDLQTENNEEVSMSSNALYRKTQLTWHETDHWT